MRNIRVTSSGGSYDVIVDTGLIGRIGSLVSSYLPKCHTAVITDSTVNRYYADSVMNSFRESGFDLCKFVFQPGENQKNLETVSKILEFLAKQQMTRSDLIIGLGGGICGDMAGFAAAIYLRGIRFIQVPTTLLAAVDSSVGGKTGVNLTAGKNLAGAFWQPSLVLCDPQVFATLSPELLADGMAESIKHGVLADRELFAMLANSDPNENWEDIVARNVEIKAGFVAEDTLDKGVRQLLNFGHTIGHAVEKCSDFSISHGHAVAMGMVIAARSAEKKGLCEEPLSDQLSAVLKKYGLPSDCPFNANELTRIAMQDKKRSGDKINLVIPKRIGKCVLQPTDIGQLKDFIESGLEN
jgi:3-dehydroquinate synthase